MIKLRVLRCGDDLGGSDVITRVLIREKLEGQRTKSEAVVRSTGKVKETDSECSPSEAFYISNHQNSKIVICVSFKPRGLWSSATVAIEKLSPTQK